MFLNCFWLGLFLDVLLNNNVPLIFRLGRPLLSLIMASSKYQPKTQDTLYKVYVNSYILLSTPSTNLYEQHLFNDFCMNEPVRPDWYHDLTGNRRETAPVFRGPMGGDMDLKRWQRTCDSTGVLWATAIANRHVICLIICHLWYQTNAIWNDKNFIIHWSFSFYYYIRKNTKTNHAL